MTEAPQAGTLGVVGTLVWDRIFRLGDNDPVEGWGGIAYALAGASAALPPGWRIRPVVKVGGDLERSARTFLDDLPGVDASDLLSVPEPNNRVELRYVDTSERTERLTGGVPGWSAGELLERASGCDALLVNFISGAELSLEDAEEVRAGYPGVMFADLHSLFLDLDSTGDRRRRPLVDAVRWMACFDFVQMNEWEFELIGLPAADGEATGRAEALSGLLHAGPRGVFVTLGPKGATAAVSDGIARGERPKHRWPSARAADSGRVERVDVVDVTVASPLEGDPTGCGDVWGAVVFSRLLAGDGLAAAMDTANRLAAVSVGHRGVTGLRTALARHLKPGNHPSTREAPL